MTGLTKSLVTTFLSAAMLLTGAAQAMEIRQFDRMADQDQAEYVGLLVQGAERVLADEGKADVVQKVHQLFTTKDPASGLSMGMKQFEMNLAQARIVDADNALNDPKIPRLEVEHAMIRSLNQNGIVLPKTIMTVMKDFKPKFSPQLR
jgi:hypothetical protein